MESQRRCLSCTVVIEKIIDSKDFDADETPGHHAVANGVLVTCASCLRDLNAPVILTHCSGCGAGLIKLISPQSYVFETTPRNHGVNMGARGILCGACLCKSRDAFVREQRFQLSLTHGRDYAMTARIELDLLKIVEADDA